MAKKISYSTTDSNRKSQNQTTKIIHKGTQIQRSQGPSSRIDSNRTSVRKG